VSVALRGNLRDFGIADVFQLIGQQRKTGVLEFRGEQGEHVQIRFDRGAVVSAAPVGGRAEEALAEMLVRCGRLTSQQVDRLAPECEASAQTVPRLAVSRGWIDAEELVRIEDLLTRETFFQVLRWELGEFDFRAQDVEHSRCFESLLGAEQILMDGLRMVDEWHSFTERIPSQDAVFERVAGFEEYRARSSLDAAQLENARRVFLLVDGRISVRRIVDLSLLGSFDTVRLLCDLLRAEVIEPLDSDALDRLQTQSPTRPAVERAGIARGIAGVLPLILLAGLLAFATTQRRSADLAAGFSVGSNPREAIWSAYQTRRVRHALEAHRFAEARWPETLEDLEARGLVAEGVLAPAGGHPYYYALRDGGALLLAPER
jgi:hypothetical protein